LDPVLDGLYVAPLIALVPLIIIWFGLGLLGKMAFIFTFPFFVIVFNTEAGVTETPEGLVHAAKAYGADPIDVYTRVHLRHSIPYIFTGLRLGAGRAVRGVVVAELFISAANIGRYLMEAGGSFEVDKLFAGVLSLSVLGIIALRTVRIIELSLLDYKR
jgi:NitT/TauT family transport system permease protein